jgi:hypothetical protein
MRIVSAWLALVWVLTGAYGGEVTPLFGVVTGVAAYDVLNVRSRPDYRAPKMGALDPDTQVYVDRCRTIGRSRWCRIHTNPLMDNQAKGWVNARFLHPVNRGYVTIKGRKNGCFYALSCAKGGQCDVVTALKGETKITAITRARIPRSKLQPANNFEAMDESEEGYCVSGRYIEDFLGNQKLTRIQKQWRNPAFDVAVSAVHAIADGNISALSTLIHPTHGVLLSDKPVFGTESRHYTRRSLPIAYKQSHDLLWGHDDAKGDPIRKSLYNYFDALVPALGGLTRVDKETAPYHYFDPKPFAKVVGYSLRWINQHSATRDYDWRGLVIILAQDHGRWYVVGLLRDYWTI